MKNSDIKFRAYIKELWVTREVKSINFSGKTVICWNEYGSNSINSAELPAVYHFSEVILMQYTGRTDRKGTELYVWDVYWMWFEYEDWTHKYWDRNIVHAMDDYDICDEFEIIWNVNDNPELFNHKSK